MFFPQTVKVKYSVKISSLKCPPLIKTALGPMFSRNSPARLISSTVVIWVPVNTSASGIFGVRTSALQISSDFSASIALVCGRLCPPLRP